MEPREYDIMFRAEDSHWWYQGMSVITRRVMESRYQPGSDLRILDAGCGTGGGMGLLSRYGQVMGFDISSHALALSRMRGHRDLALASLMAIPFADGGFDLVTSFDVLYFRHVQDDLALREFSRVLVPGGRVILRVPAYDWLRGTHDERVSTGHRYTVKELSRKMTRNGFRPEFISYTNTLLFPLAVLKRLFEKALPPRTDSDLTVQVGPLGHLFRRCLALESRIIRRWTLPFGLSIIALGEKPSG